MDITALAPWFGSNRMLSEHVGRLLEGCQWVGVAYAGGMSELREITARTMLVNDLHRHIINAAMVVGQPDAREILFSKLDGLPFHPDILLGAQERSAAREAVARWATPDVEAAADYLVCAWMGRSGLSGTDGEFRGGLPIRWGVTGGDSCVRFRSFVASIEDWGKVMARCNFTCMDAIKFIDAVEDLPNHGLYCDPPFPGPGDKYKHKFVRFETLAEELVEFRQTRVVCRFYDHPLIRQLFPEPAWTWHLLEGRKQSNSSAPEVLLVNDGLRDDPT